LLAASAGQVQNSRLLPFSHYLNSTCCCCLRHRIPDHAVEKGWFFFCQFLENRALFWLPRFFPPPFLRLFHATVTATSLLFFFFSFLGPISDSLSGLAIAGVVLGIETEVSR
jgi:hypothetical protein